MIREVKAVRGKNTVKAYVAEERDLRLIVNDKIVADLKLSPEYEEECAIGYCAGEGFIKDLSSISEIEIKGNVAKIKAKVDFDLTYERYLSTDCISGWRTRIKTEDVYVTSDLKIDGEDIKKNMLLLQKKSKTWRRTGGVHSVGLVNKGEFLIVEDVSRHIAIDKIIGIGLKKGVDFPNSYILTTGRLPGDMVIKVARVNIPIIASRTAPLYSGIECAYETGLTLVGFVRGRRMNIYAHPERIRI